MLPFMKPKPASSSGLIVTVRKPDENPHHDKEESTEQSEAIKSCAQDLIAAVHSHNVDKVAEAISCAFAILEAAPHEEEENDDQENEE